MEFDKNLIEYLANLSKLKLSEDESVEMYSELSEIVQYFETLKTLDTENSEELSLVFPITNVMRDDTVQPSFSREEILKNAPTSNDESFVVPKAVE